MLYIAKIPYQKDWGDHPQTGDWTEGYTVFNVLNAERVTKRFYSSKKDAERGAAQIYNHIEKSLLGG